MSYLNNLLVPGEEILYRTRKSKIILADTVFFTLVAAIYVICFYTYGWFGGLSVGERAILAFAPLFIALLLLFFDIISFIELEIIITNKRVLGKKGIQALSLQDVPLNQITNTTVDISIFGRLFRYGTVSIFTPNSKFDYNKINNPLRLQQTINQLVLK